MAKVLFCLNRSLALLLGGAIIAFLDVSAHAKSIDVLVSVNEMQLSLSVKNISKAPIRTQNYKLPWGNWYSVRLVAIAVDVLEGRPIDSRNPVDDSAPVDIQIKPNVEVRGAINLATRFPMLERELARTDVIIFWYYGFKLSETAETEPFSGSVLLRRRSGAR